MTLTNCRAPFRQPAADEPGRQHPIIAAQRGEKERKEEKKAQLSGPRLRRAQGCNSNPGSLRPALHHARDSLNLFLNLIYFFSPSLPRPPALCIPQHHNHGQHPADPFPAGNSGISKRRQGLEVSVPLCPPREHRSCPNIPGSAQPWLAKPQCHGEAARLLPPPPPLPPRVAPGPAVAAWYIQKGHISAPVK